MNSAAISSMRILHVNGGPGVVISGLVWLFAAIIFSQLGFIPSLIAFFIGGMMIHPVAMLVSSKLRTATVLADKKLSRLAVLTLPLLFGGLYLAYIMSIDNQTLFYPIMAVAIGARYMMFKLIYGLKTFVFLGFVLVVIGVGSLWMSPFIIIVPILVGMIEVAVGVFLTRGALKPNGNQTV